MLSILVVGGLLRNFSGVLRISRTAQGAKVAEAAPTV